jgi:hypothetical protein
MTLAVGHAIVYLLCHLVEIFGLLMSLYILYCIKSLNITTKYGLSDRAILVLLLSL